MPKKNIRTSNAKRRGSPENHKFLCNSFAFMKKDNFGDVHPHPDVPTVNFTFKSGQEMNLYLAPVIAVNFMP